MKPVLQALVLAERVYEDKRTGKKIIAGTFNEVRIGPVPQKEVKLSDGSTKRLVAGGTDPGCPAAYLSLTDVVDGTEIALQFVNMSKNEVLFQTGLKINVNDRLATIEVVAPLPAMSALAREPGTFSFDVVWNGEILGSHRLIVRNADKADADQAD